MAEVRLSADVEEIIRGMAKAGESATKSAKNAADAVGKITAGYIDADKAMQRFATNQARQFQRMAMDAGKAAEAARKAAFTQDDREKADAIRSWELAHADIKAARRPVASGTPTATGEIGANPKSSGAEVAGTLGAISLAAASVVSSFDRAAAAVNNYNNTVATLGKGAGGRALDVDRNIRELGHDQEGLRQWAMTADTANGITTSDKSQFLANLAGVNKSRTGRGLQGFTAAEQKRAMDLYSRGGGVAFGAGGEDITEAMASPQYNGGNLDHVMRWQTRGRMGGYQGNMSAEDIADQLRGQSGGMAAYESKLAAAESGQQAQAEARNFRGAVTERQVNAIYQNDTAPGGRLGFDPHDMPLGVGWMFGNMMENSEKASIRAQLDGDTSSDIQHSPIQGTLRALGFLKRQTEIMERQSVPRPTTRQGDQ